MDGENNGSKPYEQMDDLGGFPIIFGSTPIWILRLWIFLDIYRVKFIYFDVWWMVGRRHDWWMKLGKGLRHLSL